MSVIPNYAVYTSNCNISVYGEGTRNCDMPRPTESYRDVITVHNNRA